MTARELAFQALIKTATDKSFSNLTLDALFKTNRMELRDKQLATALFYGVLERKLTLDYQIQQLAKKSIDKLDVEVVAVLEMGIYQLVYMDSVPESAAVNESVNLIKSTPKVGASGFVNGVLRSFIRNRCCILLPPKTDKYRRAEVEYSLPQWIIKLWERDYSYPAAISLAKACMGRPPLHFRINTLKISVEKAKELLTAQHMTVSKHPLLPNCLTVEQSGSIAQMKAYRQGMFYVQDASSQLCAEALGAMPGERIFDLCAAPGSKSFTIAQLMENQGEILSFDLYEQRVKLIAESVERLSITCIKAMLGDACQYNEKLGVADRVLCDVPCSGLGIIRRKPEIKYKSQEEVEKLPIIQRKILENGAKYVRSGGVLVYSTCSLNKDENNRVVKWFLENHPEFEPDPLPEKFQKITGKVSYTVTLAPHKGGFDGFFIARLKKK